MQQESSHRAKVAHRGESTRVHSSGLYRAGGTMRTPGPPVCAGSPRASPSLVLTGRELGNVAAVEPQLEAAHLVDELVDRSPDDHVRCDVLDRQWRDGGSRDPCLRKPR